jgi:acetyl-CoA C-acetyltransferase
MNEIGLTKDDPRDLTLTGGLPYFGGPWSNYSLHSIITAIDLIRNDPSLKIMIVANGGYNSKQSFGIYGMDPPNYPWRQRDDILIQQSILKDILPKPLEEANGNIKVDGYIIAYNRSGQPEKGIIIGTLETGR